MREARFEKLLRDARAHPADALDETRLAAARESALARFAAERAVARCRTSALRLLETAALPLAAAAVLFVAADWLGGLWSGAEEALRGGAALPALDQDGIDAALEALAAQPWLVVALAAAGAALWLPPVRAALAGEADRA
jgi:hypothetical protein